MSYPAARYHETLAPKLVHSEEEDAELGKAWRNTPFPPVAPPPALPVEDLQAMNAELVEKLASVTAERDELAAQLPQLQADLVKVTAALSKRK